MLCHSFMIDLGVKNTSKIDILLRYITINVL